MFSHCAPSFFPFPTSHQKWEVSKTEVSELTLNTKDWGKWGMFIHSTHQKTTINKNYYQQDWFCYQNLYLVSNLFVPTPFQTTDALSELAIYAFCVTLSSRTFCKDEYVLDLCYAIVAPSHM